MVGKPLNAYAAAGIRSDHEAFTLEEGRERLRAGMWLLIREASAARNLHALLPLVRRVRHRRASPSAPTTASPSTSRDDGHINSMVREAVAAGVSPEDALVLATLNPATWHGLGHLGAVAPGYQADLLLLPDLESFGPRLVLKARPSGRRDPARRGARVGQAHRARRATSRRDDFRIPWEGGAGARDRPRSPTRS